MTTTAAMMMINGLFAETQTENGSLAQGDSQIESGEYFDAFEVQVEPGQVMRVELASDDFDTYLLVKAADGEQFENDDASEGDSNSAVAFASPDGGVYTVVATSFTPEETGGYTLSWTLLTLGDELVDANSELAEGDDTTADGSFVEPHRVAVEAGTTYMIEMTSDAVDTYLRVEMPGGAVQENDDFSTQSTNSSVIVTAQEDGEMLVLATTFEAGDTGAYNLVVREAE